MAARAQNANITPRGVNGANSIVVNLTLANALVAADTLDVTLPDGVSEDLVPAWFRVYSTATPAVELTGPAEANLRITNHNRTTGVTRFTAAGAGIAQGAKMLIGYEAV